MQIRRIIMLVAASVLCFSASSFASEIDQRVRRAYEQIDRGIQSGDITRDEARRLKSDFKKIRDDEERLNNELDRLEKNIYRAKNNDYRGHDNRNDGLQHPGSIRVIAGTYGQNCGAVRGNKTQHLINQCDGKRQCRYIINYQVIGDPAPGCAKAYTAEWRCGDHGRVQSATAQAEATGSEITLSCQ